MNNNDRTMLQGIVHNEDEDSDDFDEYTGSLFEEPLKKQQWDRVIELAKSNDGPREAKREAYDDYTGNDILPLELACTLNAPYPVVEAILHAFPEVLNYTVEFPPIHCASAHHSDVNVMSLLLREDSASEGPKRISSIWTVPIVELLRSNQHITTDMVKLFLEAHPRALGEQFEYGSLPLHYACSNNAVVRNGNNIMKILLEAYPKGAQIENSDRQLPIHVFVENCSSKDVLQLLIEAYPEGVKHVDQNGRLPIHIAVQHITSEDEIKLLIEAYPESLYTKDRDGNCPIHLLCGTGTHEYVPIRGAKQNPVDVIKIMKVLLVGAPDSVISTTQDRRIDRDLFKQNNHQHSSEQTKLYYPKEIAKHYGKPSEVIKLLEQYEQTFFVSLALNVVGHQKTDNIDST